MAWPPTGRRSRSGGGAIFSEIRGAPTTSLCRRCEPSSSDSTGDVDTSESGTDETTTGEDPYAACETSDLTAEELLAGIDHIVVVMMENRSFDHFFGSLTLDQTEDISALLFNTLPVFDGMVRTAIDQSGGNWPDSGYSGYGDLLAYAAGMQLALWEIIHDPASGDLASGDFSVDTVPDPDIALGRSDAETFLAGIAGGWTYQPGFTFQYAKPVDAGNQPVPNGQDRLWVVIPEPSSALLGGLSLLSLLRRRRA